MTLVQSTTRIADAQALWTHQLRGKAVVDALTAIFTTESQAWEQVAQDILTARTIDGAVGGQLDELGLLVGQPREDRTDDRYRVWIRARIRANRSSGSPVDMYAISRILLGDSAGLWLRQIPTGHALQSDTWSPTPVDDLWRIMQGASSAGVPFWYLYLLHDTSTFTIGSTTGWTPTAAQGLGSGRFRGIWGDTTRAEKEPGLTVLESSLERWKLDRFITEGETITSIAGEYYAEALAHTGANTAPTGHLNTLKSAHTEIRFAASSADPLIATEGRITRALRGGWSLAWVGKPAVAGSPPSYAFHAFGAGGTSYRIYSGSDGKLVCYLDSGASITSQVFSNLPHTPLRASVYVLTYDGAGELSFYVNGVVETKTITHRAEMDTMVFDEFRFGAFQNNYGTSWGSMYDLAVFDTGLTSQQALDLSSYWQAEYLEAQSAFSESAHEHWSSELGFTAATAPGASWDGANGLSLVGGAAATAGAYRQGLIQGAEFSSAGHYLTAALDQGLIDIQEQDRPWTVYWYGAQGVASGVMTVIDFNDDATGLDYTQVRSNIANIQIEFVDGGASSVMTATGAAPGDTDPHTWVVVYDGGGAGTVYVDGVPTAFSTVTAPTQTNITHVTVGNLNSTKSPYWGTLGCIGVLPYGAGFDRIWQLHTDMVRRFTR